MRVLRVGVWGVGCVGEVGSTLPSSLSLPPSPHPGRR